MHSFRNRFRIGLYVLAIQLGLTIIQTNPDRLQAGVLNQQDHGSQADRALAGDPVDLATGLFIFHEDDIVTSEQPPTMLTRTYRNRDQVSRGFGVGSTHQYDIYLIGDGKRFSYHELILPDGRRIRFERISPGTGHSDAVFEHTATPTEFYRARMEWDRFGWTIHLTDGSSYSFRGCNDGTVCGLIRHTDVLGKTVEIKRDDRGRAKEIITPHRHRITLDYDNEGRIKTATYRSDLNAAQRCDYEYDLRGRLVKVRKRLNTLARTTDTELLYSYDNFDQMRVINWPGLSMKNDYDDGGRVIRQILSNGRIFKIDYVLDDRSRIIQGSVQNPDGTRERITFNPQGYPLTDIKDFGLPTERVISYQRDNPGNWVIAVGIRCRNSKGPVSFQTEENIPTGKSSDAVVKRLEDRCKEKEPLPRLNPFNRNDRASR